MTRALALASCMVLAVVLPGCPSQSSACECAAGAFCCLGACLPLGSTCPPNDAAAVDAPRDANDPDARMIDCAARPTPSGGSAVSASRCMGNAIWFCTGTPSACNAGYECVEWLDAAASMFRASCVEAGRMPCDLAAGDTCDGTTLVLCQATGAEPTIGPPGLTVRADCVARNGPDSTCLRDADGARCTSVACDPASFVSTCIGDDRFADCDGEGVTRYSTCGPRLRCLANDLTAPDATCIPRGAPESTTRSADLTVLGCAGEAVLVAQWGYQWGESCDGQVCRGTGSAARCRGADAVACDAASYVPTCASDDLHEIVCLDGFTEPRYCGIALISGSVPSACDDTTGVCVPRTFCGPTATDRCDPTGRYRIRCDDTWGREVADPCASCTDASGSVVCG